MDSTQLLLGLLLGSVVLVAIVAIIGGYVHYRRERLLTHQERMRALELGRELPDDAATARIKAAFGTSSSGSDEVASESLPRKVFTTALWVAFWGFLAACQEDRRRRHRHRNRRVNRCHRRRRHDLRHHPALPAPATPTQTHMSKPTIDSDAYDVVSRRG